MFKSKSIEVVLELYSIIFEVFGTVLLAMARLTAKFIPVCRNFINIVTSAAHYSHIRARMNTIRDMYLLMIAECILLGKDLEKAAEDNKEDFLEITEFGREAELVMSGFSGSFKRIEAKVGEYVTASEEDNASLMTWIESSPAFAVVEEAIKGQEEVISESKLWEIVADEFHRNTAPDIAKTHFEVGGDSEDLSHILNGLLTDREGAIAKRMERDFEAEGKFTYSYKGVRYVVLKTVVAEPVLH